ncbi:MAG: TlpA family protein disulfide reductase [Candidatus Aminicenantes bacterium]|nr:MAG: TlpA family protein disulfide reductase [Candidatus Aminicenantes bacterium]RPJ03294.1 MAG: TlpA family protein disulfide reductase [Candidatus Aminicenantes bacterium]
MDIRKQAIFVILLLALSAASRADDGVKIGDAPPPLSVEEWIKGEPVAGFEPGRVYLVEFWGTWCGPCVKNIPHLSMLQKEYGSRGLIVIGVASHEWKGREALTEFMKARGAEMAYRVAFDADQSMERAWDTDGHEGTVFRLPLSFVIDRGGRVSFVGHPEDKGMDEAVAEAIAKR